MDLIVLKLAGPVSFALVWAFAAKALRRRSIAGPAFFLTTFAACSSNFEWIYREIGQAIMAAAALYVVGVTVREQRVLRANVVLLGFGAFVGISLVWNPLTATARDAALNGLVVCFAANYLLLTLRSHERLAAFARYYVLIGCWAATLAVAEALALQVRAEVTFSNPNYLGYFLGPACAAALHSPGVRGRWASWVLLTVGIVVTGSRAALAFPALAVLAVFSSHGMPQWRRAVCSIAAVGAFAALSAGVDGGVERDLAGSNTERLRAIESGLAMAVDRPLTGIGWGRFEEEFWPYLSRSTPWLSGPFADHGTDERQDMVSHNDYVRVVAELGIPAGGLFLLTVATSVVLGLRDASPNRWFVVCALLGGAVFALVHNNLNSSLFWFFLLAPYAVYWRERAARRAAVAMDPAFGRALSVQGHGHA